MFPKARSLWPAWTDWIVTANSGELVPKATTVRPITKGEIPKAAARRVAPRKRSSAPIISKPSPKMKRGRVTLSIEFLDPCLLILQVERLRKVVQA
jgi:hypothetical protein